MRNKLIQIVVVAVLTSMQLAAAEEVQHPDKKLVSRKVTGRLLSSQQGDYFHVSVKAQQGSEQSFFVDNEICFLAQNREEVLTIEFDEVERFFPEGNGYFPANIIQSITMRGGEKRWARNMSSEPSAAEWNECSRVLLTLVLHRSRE